MVASVMVSSTMFRRSTRARSTAQSPETSANKFTRPVKGRALLTCDPAGERAPGAAAVFPGTSPGPGPGPRAERADIESVRPQRGDERGVIQLGIVRQGDDRGPPIELELRQRLVRPFGRERDVGEACVAGKRGARIDHGHEVAGDRRHPRQRLGNMHGTDDEAAQARVEDLDEDRALGGVDRCAAVLADRLADRRERGRVEAQRPHDFRAFEKALSTALEVRRQHGGASGAAGGKGLFEECQLHSTRSTKTWILPPQASPTSQARSLVTPKLRSRGSPSAMVLRPSSMTAPSTQPPETEPMKPPPCSSATLAPTRRGDEPQVDTTVASATPLPAPRHSAACCRISSLSPIAHPASRQAAAASRRRGPGRLNALTRSSKLSRLWTGRNSSTWGRIARMPNDFGAKPS